jgi:transposase
VDEKAFRKGHRYHTIVCDLDRATVEYVAEDRRVESLGAYYDQLTPTQRDALAGVAMDMWEPYIQATRTRLPAGDQRIIFDRFHVMREMTKAVDTVRKHEHRAFLRAEGESPLTHTKYFWLFSEEERVPERHAEAFAAVQALNLKVGRAWAIKEGLRTLWTFRQGAAVRRFFDHWYAWAIRSRMTPVKQVARMIHRHLDGVLRFVKHPITKGVAEGLNSMIMSIKRKPAASATHRTSRRPSTFTAERWTSTHADPGRGSLFWGRPTDIRLPKVGRFSASDRSGKPKTENRYMRCDGEPKSLLTRI